MQEYIYILEPYKGMNTRYHCPSCKQKDKTFSLYLDTKTGKHIHPSVGRCNRESSCGYHYTPKQYFQDNNILYDTSSTRHNNINNNKLMTVIPQIKTASYITVEIFKASLNKYNENNFIKFLINMFGEEISDNLIRKYFIGTSKYWNGATVFWQIDIQGNIRTGKIMLYDTITGKRVKEPFNHINWVHTALKQSEFELKQCFFGEHLLIDKIKPVAIVESEKTAIIASVYLPQFIWLAVGSLTNLNAEKCHILRGRKVTLFPDLNGFYKWNNIMQDLSHLATFTISDLLEYKATEAEKRQGLDIADYLIRFDYREFTVSESQHIQQRQLEENIQNASDEKVEKQPMTQPTESELFFSEYFTGYDDYFLKVTAGHYSVSGCLKEIKSRLGYDMPEHEFIRLILKFSAPMPEYLERSFLLKKNNNSFYQN